MEGWKEYNYRMYEHLHCPFCGSTDIDESRESTVTPLLQRMEKMGIITRLRGKEDKRQQIVFLTDKGIEMEQQAYEKIPAAMGERLAACKLKKKDYERLAQHLDLLIEALGEK